MKSSIDSRVSVLLLSSTMCMTAEPALALTGDEAAAALAAFWESEYSGPAPAAPAPVLTNLFLTRAVPDECSDADYPADPASWKGSTNGFLPDGSVFDPITGRPIDGKTYEDACKDLEGNLQGKPKFNENYVWGLRKVGSDLWFGTMANTECVISGGRSVTLGSAPPKPGSGNRQLCEYNYSYLVRDRLPPGDPVADDPAYNLPEDLVFPAGYEAMADWRRPHIRVRLASGELDDKTDDIVDFDPTTHTDLHEQRLNDTLGIRFVSSIGNTVLAGGPTIEGGVGGDGINLFVFQADTRAFLNSCTLAGYNDIRKGVEANGALYFPVRKVNGRGAVLRWTGTQAQPCQFTNVGDLDNMGAEIVQFGQNLVVGTWIDFSLTQTVPATAGLYLSPILPRNGLTSAHRLSWKKVWDWARYEPDRVTSLSVLTGAMAVYNNWLYFGEMEQPNTCTQAAQALAAAGLINLDTNADGQVDSAEMTAVRRGCSRPVAFLRARNLGKSTQQVQLLYGNNYLPTYNPQMRTYTVATDAAHQNKMKATPMWGKGGFDCVSNFYNWSMTVAGGRLFIGTADGILNFFTNTEGNSWVDSYRERCPDGADLLRIDSNSGPAIAESRNGVGNTSNNGIRNMQPGANGPIVGTANARNLTTGANPGGWELREFAQP
jgi:hypothetical protein